MTSAFLFSLVGVGLFAIGLHALIRQVHLLHKILAINVMGSGVFLLLVALAKRAGPGFPDAVPHAMVITGIVVAISATALALTLMLRLAGSSGVAALTDDQTESE